MRSTRRAATRSRWSSRPTARESGPGLHYYLDKHGIPPEPDLVAHIRAQGHRPPEVDDATMEVAIEIATGQREPGPAPPAGHAAPPPMPGGPPPYPEQPAPMGDDPLAEVERRLKEPGADPGAYRINQSAEGAWSLLAEGGRWSVFLLQNGRRRKQMVCDTQERAAVYLLGAVLFFPRPLR